MGPWTKIAALFALSAPLGLFASACTGTQPSTEEDPAADTVTAADEVLEEASSAEERSHIRDVLCEFRCRDDRDRCLRHGERRCLSDFDRCMSFCRRR